MKFIRPIKDVWYVTVPFGVWYFLGKHTGVDLRTKCTKYPSGIGTPIYAPADGTWGDVIREKGYGLNIRLKHKDGFETRFCHLSKANYKPGWTTVKQGDLIGWSGNDTMGAKTSTAPHLHLECRVGGKLVDFCHYL